MKMKSLLSKTLTQFTLCTAAILVLTAPLFYLLTKWFYAEDMIDIIEAVEHGEGIPPLDLERDIMAGMMLQFLLIFLVVSLSLFITMRFITRRLWLPFDDTLDKAERFNITQDSLPRFLPTDIREFERLNRSLDSLMRRDREMFRIQKEFTENASHELQTPIAIIRSKLDMLMQENLTERQMQLVADMYGLTMRMGHLNRNLLILAKIDNAQYTAAEKVDAGAMLSESLPLYGVLRKDTPLHVDDRRGGGDRTVRANSVLLECMLKNLIINAIRNSPAGSAVNIILEDDSLTVRNVSEDGRPLDAATLFRRFRSGDMKKKGNGLGLAIVKSVCDFHGWTVSYGFDDGCKCLTVRFLNAETQRRKGDFFGTQRHGDTENIFSKQRE